MRKPTKKQARQALLNLAMARVKREPDGSMKEADLIQALVDVMAELRKPAARAEGNPEVIPMRKGAVAGG